jgi:hypothetical protein
VNIPKNALPNRRYALRLIRVLGIATGVLRYHLVEHVDAPTLLQPIATDYHCASRHYALADNMSRHPGRDLTGDRI